MKIAYLDCFAGISGDMTLGALVDAGLELETLKSDLALLPLKGYEIIAENVVKKGIGGTKIRVVTREENSHRHLADIEAIIKSSSLPESVKNKSLSIFARLAEAEAKVHRTTPDKVHFHEVGAVDAIVDIVGAVCGFWRLGITEVYASSVRTGTGFIECDHGLLPVPAPATLELLKGIPVYGGGIEKELVTPTGAAILTSYCRDYGSFPSMRVISTGYGAGGWDLEIPNLLRLTIGEKSVESGGQTQFRFGGRGDVKAENALMLEVNLDDMNPELYDYLMQLLLDAGAMDVSLVPLQMKKNRPGTMLKVLLSPSRLEVCQELIFKETTAIGLRVYPVQKFMLPYEIVSIEGDWGQQSARVKLARLGEKISNIAPEYEDCREIAREQKRPLKEIYQEVKREATKKYL